MLTLEKLLYQHQNKPLELSTYLSDYLRDARSCSYKPEACNKRLYQLFHRFVSKFSSFQDPNLSHLILSISFQVLTYLCETSRESFVSFFEFGLGDLLLEEIPLTEMTQNENTFSEFVSLLHLLCDNYTQSELSPLCHLTLPLLDAILLPHISPRALVLVSSLVIKLCDSLSPPVVLKIKSSRAYSTQIVKCGTRIGSLGDILLQCDVLEGIFRLTSRKERSSLSDILFTSPAVSSAFKEISEGAFERGSRHFLNTLNASLSAACKVFSYPCVSGTLDETPLSQPLELEQMWADFNTSSESLTVFISHPQDAAKWATLSMLKESFSQLALSSKDGFLLEGKISAGKSDICEAFPRSSGPVTLRLSFLLEHNPTPGMTAALGYSGAILESDSSKKPLARISTSENAIRITTHDSGSLDTQVTSNCTPAPLRETVSPILGSPTGDFRPPTALSQQQTTPVAPPPPVDPLTSTPIRKNTFTPVFTPSNATPLRNHTECVLASASSLHSSAKLSVQPSDRPLKPLMNAKPRKFTPSSLTTHVNTPVDKITIEERTEARRGAQRAKIVNQVIEENESLEQRVSNATSPPSMIINNSNQIPDTIGRTPRSIRVTNSRKREDEVSYSYKPRTAKAPRKGSSPSPPKVTAPTPMSIDLTTSSNEESIRVDASSDTSPPLRNNNKDNNARNYNKRTISIADVTRTLSTSTIRKDLSNSEDSENLSPSPVSIGAKKLALSRPSLPPALLSPALVQSRFRRIRPRHSQEKDGEREEGSATRLTQHSRQTRAPALRHAASRRGSEISSSVFTSEDSNSPHRSYALTRFRARNCTLRSDDVRTNDSLQDDRVIPVQNTGKDYPKTRRHKKRESPKTVLVSDIPVKRIYGQLSRDAISSIASANSLQIQTKSTPPPIRTFSFKLDASSSKRVNSLEKHLQQYEDNLKMAYSNSLFAIDKSRTDRVKKLFVQMKQLMVSENKDVFSKYNDWYHETRNLVNAISEMRQYDVESKSCLYEQFQLAIKQVEQSIQKEQVSAIKKRIHSFFIKI